MGILNAIDLRWAIGLISVIALYLVLHGGNRIRRDGIPLRKPPNTLPLVGNGILFLQARQKLFSWFVKCERKFGYETFQISVPSLPPGVVINDPHNLDYVFKNEGVFGKGDFVKSRSWDLFGNGIINADGELWRIQRKAGLNFLNTSNLRLLTDVALPKHIASSIEFVDTKVSSGTSVDLQAVFHAITTKLMGKLAYNMEMEAEDDFTMAFEYASGATAERFQNPLWAVTDVFFGAKLRRSVAIIRTFGKEIVASAVRDRETSGGSLSGEGSSELDKTSGSLIQSLLDSIGDHQMVADAALNYLSAGRDTTAQGLTWTFYLLTRHRHAMGKIRQEVQRVLARLGDDGIAPGGLEGHYSPDPTQFTPTTMPYTLAVFYEALRLFPPIPFEIKQCERATTLPDGTFLPVNSVVVWCPWAMNRSLVTWGPDAGIFQPERWLLDVKDTESGVRVVTKSPSEFPVFNGGPRTCLGKRMAESIAVQVIAAFAWEFDFVPAFEGERVSKSSLTLPMQGGLPCFARKRSIKIEME